MQGASNVRIPLGDRLTVRLAGGVIVVLLLIGVPFLLAFHRLLRAQQRDALTEVTSGFSRMFTDALRASMLAGEPHLANESVRSLAREPAVERVMLVDHEGRVSIATDPSFEGRVLDREHESTCNGCHRGDRNPPVSRTAITRIGGRRVFRTMTVIPNEPQCHACHDATASVNGILLMDFALEAADRRFFTGFGGTLALGSAMVLLTVVVLILLLRRMVHLPLRSVVLASQKVVQGDLDARSNVPARGEFMQLALQVNRMTDHLSGSIRSRERQRRELQEILDAVDDEIVVLDRERRIVAVNEAARETFGRPDLELTGRLCHEVSAEQWPCMAGPADGCPVQKVFNTGRLNKGIVSRSGPDGRERFIEIHASPLRGVDGSVNLAVEVRRDISERRQMEAILAHSEHLASLGLLASGLSHEINNPLGAIATSVEGLRRRLLREPGISGEATDRLDGVLARIANEVQRGKSITDRLLRVARPPGITRSLVDVNHVVEEIVAILSHDIRRFGITTDLQLASSLPPLLGDESLVSQVVMNLTLNAIQAMADGGGTLRVHTRSDHGTVRIDVEDEGCGIPPTLRKRIFEPFFTTKPVGQGTGLGLFITHQIVTQLDGTVEARSRSVRGTVFTVRLPVAGKRGEP